MEFNGSPVFYWKQIHSRYIDTRALPGSGTLTLQVLDKSIRFLAASCTRSREDQKFKK